MSLIKYCAYLIVLVTPFVLQKSHTLSPAELAKQINVSLLVLALFGVWIIAAAKRKITVLRWSRGLSLLALLLGSTTLSYCFSISSYISFWGDKNLPSDSLQTIIIFFILSFVFVQIFEDAKDYKRFSIVLFLTLAGQIVVGFSERYNLYEHWYSIGVVFGTIGVTVGFANLIAAIFPILLNCIFRAKNLIVLFLLYLLLVGSAVMMLYTSSRTPLIASLFIFAAISAYELYLGFDSKKLRKIGLVVLSLAVAYTFFKSDMPDGELGQKMQSRLISKAFTSRGLIWQSALQAWQDHPLVGVGPEAFIIAARIYQMPQSNDYEYWDIEWTKAHSQLIQALACTGLIGLLVHLLILGYLIYFTLKSILKKQISEQSSWLRTMGMMYLVIFISNLTCFNFITTQMYGYLALVLFSISQGPVALKTWAWELKPRLRYLLAGLVLIPTLALTVSTYSYGEADVYHQLGLQTLTKDSNTTKAMDYYFKALTYDDSDPLLYCQVSYAVAHMLTNNHYAEKTFNNLNKSSSIKIKVLSIEDKEKSLKQMTEFIDICLEKSDGKYHYYMLKAELYYGLYTNDILDRKMTTQSYLEAVEKFPNNPRNYYRLGLIAYREKEFDRYLAYLNKAIELKKDYLSPYGDLLNHYYNTRDFDKIPALVDRIEHIEFKNPEFVPTLHKLADLAQSNGDMISRNTFLRIYSKNKFLLGK